MRYVFTFIWPETPVQQNDRQAAHPIDQNKEEKNLQEKLGKRGETQEMFLAHPGWEAGYSPARSGGGGDG